MIIYKVVNLINKKIYIGQTELSLNKRKNLHKTQSLNGQKNTYFSHAIRKYGFNSFVFEIIDKASNLEELDEKEKFWIKFYNSRDKKLGYNIAEGGRTNRGTRWNEESRRKHSEKQREDYKNGKRKIWNKGEKWSDKTDKNHSRLGRKHTEISKMKMAKAKGVKVICIETGIIYESTLQAAKSLGYKTGSHIVEVCKGKAKKCGGYTWKYIND